MREHKPVSSTTVMLAASESTNSLATMNDCNSGGDIANDSIIKERPQTPPKVRAWINWDSRRKCDVCGEVFRTKKLYVVNN